MKSFLSLLIFAFLIFPLFSPTKVKTNLFASPNLEDGYEFQEVKVKVLGVSKTIRVIYKPDGKKKEFAKHVLETSAAYIPKVAEYLSVAPKSNILTIYDLTDGSTARNEGSRILIPFAYPDPQLPIPAPLLYHEISHWWFGQEPRWISEGVSSFLPIALYESGILSIDHFEIHKIKSWWGLRNPMPKNDFPLGDKPSPTEESNGDFPLYYEKSFKIQYLIYLELGQEGYKNFLISLMNPDHENWHDYSIAPSDSLLQNKTRAVFQLLNAQKSRNWEKFLSGWVQNRGYTTSHNIFLADADGDSILDMEEKIRNTDPSLWDTDKDRLGDFAELAVGTNPILSDELDVLKEKLEDHGIVLDGMGDDWEILETQSYINPESQKNKHKIPLTEFRYKIKGKTLYGMLKGSVPFFELESKYKELYFFLVDASESKERSGFGFRFHFNDAYGWENERTAGEKKYVWGKVGHVFEFKIDLSGLPSKELKLIPLLNGKSGPSLGHWSYTDPIVIPVR